MSKIKPRVADVVTDVVCPFYHKDDGLKVRCEGFCNAVTIQLSFTSLEQKQVHKHTHCMEFDGYPKCPIYPVINKQYMDEEKW